MSKKTAILLAGGSGSRFDPHELKTLYNFNGKTLTELVIERIKSFEIFDEIVLVYNEKHKEKFVAIAEKNNLKCTPGGSTRFYSAYVGITNSTSEKNIFIDVAAPFFRRTMILEILSCLDDFEGVATGIIDARADHILVENKKVVRILPRGAVVRNKSFQGVNKTPWLKYCNSTQDKDKYTEMLRIILNNNGSVGFTHLDTNPRKLTTKKDLKLIFK